MGEQRQRAVARVFIFPARKEAGFPLAGGGQTLERLHACLFIHTDGVDTLRMALGSLAIRLTDLVHCGIKGGWGLIALMIQPVKRAMWLEIGLRLKNAPPCGARCA